MRSEAEAGKRLRGSVRIEDVLRQGAAPGLLVSMARPLLGVLPGGGRALAGLAAWVALEVAAFFAVSAVARAALASAAGGGPGVTAPLVAAGLVAACALFAVVSLRFARQERIVARWQERLFDRLSLHVAEARYEDLASVPMAGLREILMTDVPQAARFYVELFATVLVVALWMAALAALLVWRGAGLALGLGALLAGFAVLMALLLRAHMRLTAPRFRAQSDLSERARDLCEHERAAALRQYGLTARRRAELLDDHARLTGVLRRQAVHAQTGRAALMALNGAGFLLLALLGGALIARGEIASADLFAALFLTMQLFAALTHLGQMSGQAAETMTALRRLSLYFEPAPAPPRVEAPLDRIEMRGVAFGYRGAPPVLRGLDLTLAPGITALTGRTGAGKTTLTLLASGLLEPDAGTVVTGDGTAIAALAPGRVLYVGAKPVLFAGSLRDNLFAEATAPEDEPRIAALMGLMREEGPAVTLDGPLIGPGGTGLSSGQGQLVGLMRALLRAPDAVLLDEATSALDMDTEARVQEALMGWCRERIALVVSHRPCPWLDRADRSIAW